MTIIDEPRDEFLLPPVRRVPEDVRPRAGKGPRRDRPATKAKSPWRIVRRVALGLVVTVVLGLVWIGVRGALAAQAVIAGAESASTLSALLTPGSTADTGSVIGSIQSNAEQAHALTSDPVWRAFELVPVAGANLTVAREGIAALDSVARDSLPAMARLATSADPTTFSAMPRVERLAAMAALSTDTSTVVESLDVARARLTDVAAGDAVAPLAVMFGELTEAVSTYAALMEGMDGLARVAAAASTPDSAEAAVPWTIAVTADADDAPAAYFPVSTVGGAVAVGEVVPASRGLEPPQADDHSFVLDAATIRYIVNAWGSVRTEQAGSLDAADIVGFMTEDAYTLWNEPAAAEHAVGAVAAATVARLFD